VGRRSAAQIEPGARHLLRQSSTGNLGF